MLRSRRTNALLALALSVPLFVFEDGVLAIQDSEDKVWFGPVGITPLERALINVYSVGNPNETPWTFVVRVFDPRGELVQEQKLQLTPGVTGSVLVAIQDEEYATAARLSRRTFRAEIVGFNPQPDPPGRWTATLEVVDRLTGRTSVLIGNPDVLPARSK
jgi:hypothetical protein